MKELILGGVRSGKSRLAEARARESGLEVVFLATARALSDAQMHNRIEQHRRRRPSHWQTVEEPVALADCLLRLAAARRCILVECITLWLTNLLCEGDESRLKAQGSATGGASPGARNHHPGQQRVRPRYIAAGRADATLPR